MTLAIIRRAMRRALSWRLLLVTPIVLLIASAATLVPLVQFFHDLFGHSPRWREITASLDSPAFLGLLRALGTPAAAGVTSALYTSLILGVLFAPFLAGAALVVAETEVRPRLREILSGAAGYYPRLLRMQFAALVPLGVAAAVAAVVFRWASRVADRATSDAATHTSSRTALVVTIVLVLLAQLVIDAGRARLAAEPARRSALLALGAGVKLIVKRPKQTLLLALSSVIVALVVAAGLLVVRQQITQSSPVAILIAFLVAQLAVMSIAWGHAVKLCGLVEIARDLVRSGSEPEPAEAEPAVDPAVDPEPEAVPPGDVLAPESSRPVPPAGAAPSAPPES